MAVLVISYSRVDQRQVRAVVSLLQGALRGFEKAVFWDEQFEPGDLWFEQLKTHIDASQQLFVFWCAHSSVSDQVRREFMYAFEQSKRVVPVLLDDTPLSAELAPIHGIDLRGAIRHRRSPRVARIAAVTGSVAAVLIATAITITLTRAPAPAFTVPPRTEHVEVPLAPIDGSTTEPKLGPVSVDFLNRYLLSVRPEDRIVITLSAAESGHNPSLTGDVLLYFAGHGMPAPTIVSKTVAGSPPSLSIDRTYQALETPPPHDPAFFGLSRWEAFALQVPIVAALAAAVVRFRRWRRARILVRQFEPYVS